VTSSEEFLLASTRAIRAAEALREEGCERAALDWMTMHVMWRAEGRALAKQAEAVKP
jgi:hypothetical protein